MEYLRKHGALLLISVLLLAVGAYLFHLLPPSRIGKPKPDQNVSKSPVEEKTDGPDSEELEKLAALGYTNWSQNTTDVRKSGVVHFQRSKAFGGLNLYNSRNLTEAHLMDMNGKIVHSWVVKSRGDESWHTIKMMDDGGLIAIVKDQKLLRLDRNSAIQWQYEGRVHHDLSVSPTGEIYVPMRRTEMWSTKGRRIPVVKEYIVVLSSDGTFLREINLFDALSPFISEKKISKIDSWVQSEGLPDISKTNIGDDRSWWEEKNADVFHLNSIELIDRNIHGIAKKGDLLLSIRELNLICIFREATGQLVWSWGPGVIECQHHPTFLKNGNILLFDNGCKRGYSRVIEVEPATKSIVWEYKHPKDFFSYRRGSAQRLPNGNTLITESDWGNVFEVTREGNIVWEFLNPDILSEEKKRAIIYRMIRVPETVLSQTLQ